MRAKRRRLLQDKSQAEDHLAHYPIDTAEAFTSANPPGSYTAGAELLRPTEQIRSAETGLPNDGTRSRTSCPRAGLVDLNPENIRAGGSLRLTRRPPPGGLVAADRFAERDADGTPPRGHREQPSEASRAASSSACKVIGRPVVSTTYRSGAWRDRHSSSARSRSNLPPSRCWWASTEGWMIDLEQQADAELSLTGTAVREALQPKEPKRLVATASGMRGGGRRSVPMGTQAPSSPLAAQADAARTVVAYASRRHAAAATFGPEGQAATASRSDGSA